MYIYIYNVCVYTYIYTDAYIPARSCILARLQEAPMFNDLSLT